jgi:hypothetical protein
VKKKCWKLKTDLVFSGFGGDLVEFGGSGGFWKWRRCSGVRGCRKRRSWKSVSENF